MQVKINGETHTLDDGIMLSGLLQQLDLEGRRIAVEINESIVPKSLHSKTAIEPDDQIEIIHAIGGG